jgi:hypothetical protein
MVIFKPKIPFWENFGGSCNGRCWYILWTFGLFYGHLKYFMTTWYILWRDGTFSPRFGLWYQEKSGNRGWTRHSLISVFNILFRHPLWNYCLFVGVRSIYTSSEKQNKWLWRRVTRLGEFLPFGRFFNLGIFLKIS